MKSLRARLFMAGTIVVFLMAAMGYACAFMFAHVSTVVGDRLRVDEATGELVTTLTSSLEDEDDALLLALSGDRIQARKNRVVEQERFDDALGRLRALTTRPDERAALDRLDRHVRLFRASGDRLLDQDSLSDARAVYDADTTPAMRAATVDCTRIRDTEIASTRRTAAWARDEARRATTLVGVGSLAALLVALGVAVQLARAIVRPIAELTKSVEAVRGGAFDRRVPIDRTDEIGALASGYNRMAEALDEFHRAKLEEVMRAKNTLEATLSALPDAVLLIGPGGKIESANPRAMELLVLTCGRVPATISELPVSGAGAEIGRALALGAAPARAADLSRAIRVMEGDNERRFLSRVEPRGHGVSAREGAIVVFRDVTEIARLDEMRMDFVAAASHELRTPLTTLKMMLAMIAEADAPRAPHEDEMLRTALSGCEQLGQTVDAMLDLARAETGDIRLHRERFGLATLVKETLRTMAGRSVDAGVRITFADDTTGAAVDGDIARLSVVLSNVLTNALKYSATADEISVTASAREDEVVVSVVDQGPGIPAEYHERVFEKYFRVEHQHATAEDAPAHAPRGAGMGLYLCKQIVEAHGGTIRCEPSPSGKGACISISIPRRRDDALASVCDKLDAA